MAVHEILVDATSGLVEACIEFLDVFGTLHLEVADVENLVALGRDFKAFEAGLDGGEYFLGFAVHINGDDVVATGKKKSVVVNPHGVELAGGGVGEADGLVFAIGSEEIELGIALVFGDVVVGVGVDQTGTIGADSVLAHFAKLPHDFGSETPVFDCCHRFADDVLGFLLFLFAAYCQ